METLPTIMTVAIIMPVKDTTSEEIMEGSKDVIRDNDPRITATGRITPDSRRNSIMLIHEGISITENREHHLDTRQHAPSRGMTATKGNQVRITQGKTETHLLITTAKHQAWRASDVGARNTLHATVTRITHSADRMVEDHLG